MAQRAELATQDEKSLARSSEQSPAKVLPPLHELRPGTTTESPITNITGEHFVDIVRIPQKPDEQQADGNAAMRAASEEAKNRQAKLTEAFRKGKDVLVVVTRQPGSTDVKWSVVVPSVLAEQQRNLSPLPEGDERQDDEHTRTRRSLLSTRRLPTEREQRQKTAEGPNSHMSDLYQKFGMGDGTDRELVEDRAKELWEEHGSGNASHIQQRIEIAEALVGRRIESQDLLDSQETVPWFAGVILEGGPYQILEMRAEDIREIDRQGKSLQEIAQSVQDTRPKLDLEETLQEANDRYMQKLYAHLEMGDGTDTGLVAQKAQEKWSTVKKPSDRIAIVEAIAGQRFFDAFDPDVEELFTPDFMNLMLDGGDLEDVIQGIERAAEVFRQERLARYAEDAPQDGEVMFSGMSALYEYFGMGDGTDPELVAQKAQEHWESATTAEERFALTHTVLGRQVDEQDVDSMGADVMTFKTLLNEGGSYQDLMQLVDGVRTRREENLRNSEYMKDNYRKYEMGDGSDRELVREKAQEKWRTTSEPVERMEIAEALAGRRFDNPDDPQAILFTSPDFMSFMIEGGEFEVLVEKIEARLHSNEPQQQMPQATEASESAIQSVTGEQAHDEAVKRRRTEPPKPTQIVLDDGAIAELRAAEEIKARLGEFDHWRHVEVVPVLSPQGEVEGKTKDSMGMSDTGFKLEKMLTNNLPFAYALRIHPHSRDHVMESRAQVKNLEFRQRQFTDADTNINTESLSALLASLKAGELTGRFDVDVMVGGTSDEGVVEMANAIIRGTGAKELASHIDMDTKNYDSWEDAYAAAQDKRRNPRGDTSDVWLDPNIGVSLEMADRLMPSLLSEEAGGISIYEMVDWALNIPRVHEIPEERRISLGMITNKYGTEMSEIIVDIDKLFEHIGIFGTTGKGKSTLVARLTEQLARKGRPVILVDPKGGLAQICADMLEDTNIPVTELALGDLGEALIGINPLEWGENDLSQHIDNLIDTIVNAFDEGKDPQAAETTTRFLEKALRGKDPEVDAMGNVTKPRFIGLYERMGWDPNTGKPITPGTTPMKPTMLHLINVLQEAGDEQGYIMEASNVIKWLVQRQETQGTGKPGQIYNGPPLDMKKMFEPGAVTIIRTDQLSKKQFRLLGALMIDQFGDLSKYFQEKSIKEGTVWNGAHLFVDEANEIIREGTPFADNMAGKARIYRSRKAGLAFIAQSPQDTPQAIRDNINTWLLMKVQTAESMNAVKMPMGLRDAQARHVTRFNNREFAAFFPDQDMWQPVHGFAHYFRSDGSAPLHPPESLVADYAPERFIKLGDVSELNRRIFESEEGRVLRGIVETNIWIRAMGLDSQIVRGNEYKQQIPGEPNPFDELKELMEDNPEGFAYMVDKSVDRAVYAHSALFLPRTAHFTQETMENFMGKIRKAVQAMNLPSEQQGVLLDMFKHDLRKATRPDVEETLNSGTKFLRQLRRSVAASLGTGEGETFDALMGHVEQTIEATKFEYITFKMIKDRLVKDIFRMFDGSASADATPDQNFMVEESYGSFAARAMVMEHINKSTPNNRTVIEMDGIQVSDNDIQDFIWVRNFIEDNREALLAGNVALRSQVKGYLVQQQIIAARQRYKKETGREMNPRDTVEIAIEEVTDPDINYFIEHNRVKLEPDKDPNVIPQVTAYLYDSRANDARLRYQRLVERFPDEQVLKDVFDGEVPGNTAWEQYIYLKDQAKKTDKIFHAEKFYGIGHMMDSLVGTSLKEAIEKDTVKAWKKSCSDFLGSIGAKSGTLDLIFGEIETYVDDTIKAQSDKANKAAESHVTIRSSDKGQVQKGANKDSGNGAHEDIKIEMIEILNVVSAYAQLGRIAEISQKPELTNADIKAALVIINDSVKKISQYGQSAENIEIPDNVRSEIAESVQSDEDPYAAAQDSLEEYVNDENYKIDPDLKIKAILVRAKFEKIKAVNERIRRERKVSIGSIKELFQEVVQVQQVVNGIVQESTSEKNNDLEMFMKIYQYIGPKIHSLYQETARQGLDEDATDLDKILSKAKAAERMEEDLVELAASKSISFDQSTRPEDATGKKWARVQLVMDSEAYKEIKRKQREAQQQQPDNDIHDNVNWYRNIVELLREEADLFSGLLPSNEYPRPNASPSERLTDYVGSSDTRQIRLIALNDRVGLEHMFLQLQHNQSEQMSSNEIRNLSQQYILVINSMQRMFQDPDIRTRLHYLETFGSAARELVDAYEIKLTEDRNLVFSEDPADTINIRLEAIVRMQADILKASTPDQSTESDD